MTEKELIAERHISKIEVGEETYLRVFHNLSNLMTGASLFKLEEDKDNTNELYVTEVSIEEIPESVRDKVTSNDYLVEVTDDDKEMIIKVFQAKWEYLQKIAEKNLTVGFKRRLLQFIEVGGHYFGYVYEEGMPYNKLYHLIIDPSNESLDVVGVPPDLLPALIEALSSKILDGLDEFTIQVDDGVYTRVSKVNKNKALVLVLAQGIDDEGNTSMNVSMVFIVKHTKEEGWFVKAIREGEDVGVDKELKKSFEVLCLDLLSRVYEQNPQALK